MQKISRFLLHFIVLCNNIGGMKQKIVKKCNPQKDLAHLMTRPFDDKEKEVIKTARQKSGMDRPTFYHDAVVDFANRINNGGKDA